RTQQGAQHGPLNYPEFAAITTQEMRVSPAFWVSAGGQRWMEFPNFLQLSAQASLLEPQEPPRQPTVTGRLQEYGLTPLFGILSRQAASGRLVVTTEDHVARITLHVNQGAPTYITGNLPSLQFPDLLVREG